MEYRLIVDGFRSCFPSLPHEQKRRISSDTISQYAIIACQEGTYESAHSHHPGQHGFRGGLLLAAS